MRVCACMCVHGITHACLCARVQQCGLAGVRIAKHVRRDSFVTNLNEDYTTQLVGKVEKLFHLKVMSCLLKDG